MKHLFSLFAVLILFSASLSGNDSPKALQDAFVKALANNDADGIAACYSPDAVNFPVDAMMGLGPDSVRASWQSFFTQYAVKDISLSDDRMEIFGDTAAAWGIFTMMVEPAGGGQAFEMRGRYMDVARNVDGNWLYIADHASVPTAPAE